MVKGICRIDDARRAVDDEVEVLFGRAYLWGLAANGQAGVENVLDILAGGISSALLGLGKASVRDLTPEDVLVPDGFRRDLGG